MNEKHESSSLDDAMLYWG